MKNLHYLQEVSKDLPLFKQVINPYQGEDFHLHVHDETETIIVIHPGTKQAVDTGFKEGEANIKMCALSPNKCIVVSYVQVGNREPHILF